MFSEQAGQSVSKSTLSALLVLLCSATAGAVLLFSLPWGVGVFPDSVVYMRSAQAIADGQGLQHLPVHWPPAYPLFLAALGQLLPSIQLAALYGQALLLTLNGCLFALVVFSCLSDRVRGRHWLALAAVVFFLTNPHVFILHQYALSEALFAFFLLSGTASTLWFQKKGGLGRLIVAALLVGCLPVTRYAGVVIVPALVALVYLRGHTRPGWGRRIKETLVFAVITAVPLLTWLGLYIVARLDSADREIAYHPVGAVHLEELEIIFRSWFALPAPGLLTTLVILTLLGSLAWSVFNTGVNARARQFLLLFCASAILYVAFILFSISFIDANIPVDPRILFPAWLLLYTAIFISFGESLRTKYLGIAMLVCLLAIGAFGFKATSKGFSHSSDYGLGYNQPAAFRSAMLAQIKEVPQDTQLYSNARDYIYLHTGREARSLPRMYDSANMQINPEFFGDMDAILEGVAHGSIIIVYFNGFEFRRYLPTLEQLHNEFYLGSSTAYSEGAYLDQWQAPTEN